MSSVSFTGVGNPDLALSICSTLRLVEVLEGWRGAARFYTGASDGMDRVLGRILSERFPEVSQTVLVPAGDYYDWWSEDNPHNVRVARLKPNGLDPYSHRNKVLARQGDHLVAFLPCPEELLVSAGARSGTLETVNFARSLGKPVTIYTPADFGIETP